ncbi:hypothetical protein DPMN_087345 [Dreissena polymorpha]|uniref:Uncharacterized protein n=1 Tax=Dreissena polymorpha TaxID=45954 RepID=A0A9D4KS88_DREPO|nr:hypothetical protein DPMN_087345 [Dreissena polymorpha]
MKKLLFNINSIINEDIQVKVKVTSLLCHLDPADSAHCCLATEVVQLCCAQYVKVADGSTNRFANSLVHRQRHRLIQTVLLLQELVTMVIFNQVFRRKKLVIRLANAGGLAGWLAGGTSLSGP